MTEKRYIIAATVCLAAAFLLRFVLPGVRFSALLFACAAAVFALFAYLTHRGARKLKRILLVLLAFGFAFFAVLEAMVLTGAWGSADTENVDAVIVLGAGVNGERPSLTLQTRIRAAEKYLAALDKSVPVILSGGQGGGEDISEAECMRRELAALGVDETRLVLEEKSTNTRENLTNSCAILREMGLDLSSEETRIAIITNDFHLYRAKLLWEENATAEAIGVDAKLPWLFLSVNYYVREAFALAKLLVLGG